MVNKKKYLKILNHKIDDINDMLIKSNIEYLSDIVGKPKKLFFKNFFAGVARGVGIAIGFTIIGGIIVFFLQKIITLNIPIIGEYLKDISEIIKGKL